MASVILRQALDMSDVLHRTENLLAVTRSALRLALAKSSSARGALTPFPGVMMSETRAR